MHLPITQSVLLLLPLAAATVDNNNNNNNAGNNNAAVERGLGDKVKGLFGDPASMVRDLPDCLMLYAAWGATDLDCKTDVGCACSAKGKAEDGGDGKSQSKRADGDADDNDDKSKAGQSWADMTKGYSQDIPALAPSLGCTDKDFDEGKLLDICEAVGEKPDKLNETNTAWTERIDRLREMNKAVSEKETEGEDDNGTADGKSSAAAGGAGPGTVARLAGAMLAAVVGYAVAML